MTKILLVAGIVCAAVVSAPLAHAARYQLDLKVSRDGHVVTAPSVAVDEGKQADLRVHDDKNPDADLRMLVSAAAGPKQKSGKDVIDVSILFFESVNGELVLRGEPSVSVYAGTEASVKLSAKGLKRAASEYEIGILAVKADVNRRIGSQSPATEAITSLADRSLSSR